MAVIDNVDDLFVDTYIKTVNLMMPNSPLIKEDLISGNEVILKREEANGMLMTNSYQLIKEEEDKKQEPITILAPINKTRN